MSEGEQGNMFLDDEAENSIRLSDSDDDAISDEDESIDIDESELSSEDEEHEEEYSSDDELISDGMFSQHPVGIFEIC